MDDKAKAERLYMLAEEASEITHAVMKIMRHGPKNHNPYDPSMKTNIKHLEDEIIDILTLITLMEEEKDISISMTDTVTLSERWKRKLEYTTYQTKESS